MTYFVWTALCLLALITGLMIGFCLGYDWRKEHDGK